MKYFCYIFLFFVVFQGCEPKKSEKLPKEHIVKSVNFQEFKLIDISPKAIDAIHQWKGFQSLLQVIVNMAPNKMKNTENLVVTNPDSLLIYRRLYPLNSKTIFENATAERDWRTLENTKDTIFRLEKKDEKEFSFVEWEHFLVENISYFFTVFVKQSDVDKTKINFVSKEKEITEKKYQVADTTLRRKFKINKTQGEWNEILVELKPSKSDTYSVRLGLTEATEKGQNILFYRPLLQVFGKDFHKISKFSDKIVQKDNFVKSSYYSVFFWLVQVEDELKHLLNEDKFPEKINIPIIKARFRLLQTQVKELADNVKNNPDFEQVSVEKGIYNIEQTFNNIILRMNYIYESDLDEKMQYIHNQADSTFFKDFTIPNF